MANEPEVVLLTGATSGIGRATARLLAAGGYRVFGTGRRPAADAVDGFALLPLEVTSDDSVAACVRAVADRTGGRIDVLVNNVGTGILGAAEESTAAEARGLFETNFFGAVRMTNAVLPFMRPRRAGKVVNMSSAGGVAAVPFAAYYCATKHALEGYSEALRHELLPLGISVSVVGPGAVSTPAGDNALTAAHPLDDYQPGRGRAAGDYIKAIRNGMAPERVAAVVRHIVRAKNPAPRYPVGTQAKALNLVRRALPTRLFHWLVRRATR